MFEKAQAIKFTAVQVQAGRYQCSPHSTYTGCESWFLFHNNTTLFSIISSLIFIVSISCKLFLATFFSFPLLNNIAWAQVDHRYGIHVGSNWAFSFLHQELSFFWNVDNSTRVLDFTIFMQNNPIVCEIGVQANDFGTIRYEYLSIIIYVKPEIT